MHLKCNTDHGHSRRHDPFFVLTADSGFQALCYSVRNGRKQNGEIPVQHEFTEQVDQHQAPRNHEHARSLVVQPDAVCKCTQQDWHRQHRQHHVFDETLVGRQWNGVSKTSACQHALVVDFNDCTERIGDHLGTERIAVRCVPRKPREERHDHTRQRRRKPGQCADDHGYAEQNFAYANEHGQRQRPFRQSRKVQGPGFKVLFEFVHEAQGIVGLDESRYDEERPNQEAANLNDGIPHGHELFPFKLTRTAKLTLYPPVNSSKISAKRA